MHQQGNGNEHNPSKQVDPATANVQLAVHFTHVCTCSLFSCSVTLLEVQVHFARLVHVHNAPLNIQIAGTVY